MNILEIIGTFLKMGYLFLLSKIERDKERKKELQTIKTDVITALKNKDASNITAGFARIKNLR